MKTSRTLQVLYENVIHLYEQNKVLNLVNSGHCYPTVTIGNKSKFVQQEVKPEKEIGIIMKKIRNLSQVKYILM